MSDSIFADRIVQNLLDTDLYKLTMMQAVLHNYPNAEVEWEFRCRNSEDLTPYLAEIRYQFERLSELSLTVDQLAFLERIPFIKPDFIRFLSLFRFNLRYVHTSIEDGQLSIRLRGPWLHVILFEVPLLAIISEVRNRYRYREVVLEQAAERLYEKIDWLRSEASDDELAGFQLADFGTRRRFSYRAQEQAVRILKRDFPGRFVGTSNLHLAREFELKPIGTMAHEWLMAHQQLGPRLIDSQSAALDCWVREYRGQLGIALTDCITMDAFLADFDLYFAKLFDGLRHDSGDPLVWAEKAIAHYEKLGIDPLSKTLVFSDGLDLEKSLRLYRALSGRIHVSFGVGTNLTCDIPGVEPMNIVIKMIACNGQPVAKISDTPGKTQCRDENFVSYLKHVFRVTQ
ncbi:MULTISPECIES: nicotinate phosphoribosyltransferase [Pseudomonas]|uniref:Nicotinate phosphoribosyltransferase n=1 Tax=Ectopseudomonas oleovorans TaxID=301 RepID=A0A653B8M6_ECTOL|nr:MULTISPECIES: nicotinate phosphoribosyltransferase [Pseudomonas]QFT21345.1 Nicotinate phosphoribosyltransferase 2 [Pseudomonas sp. THAF187a]QFT41533.1 Nicotinate phosphoribosyltransferase 2 [Pseudomonas sp. THAF42]WFC61739.1 nicotinate phosphoribosyltransferase [Pseudomonas sp. REST10]CAE6907285.1 nicotinate phosphoribosyltransferase [Pseudomonas oleovorans]|tara:strand:- start:1114 stop:2313 length:1200 start_codon:yes stop_codon:yes gene_type:complete